MLSIYRYTSMRMQTCRNNIEPFVMCICEYVYIYIDRGNIETQYKYRIVYTQIDVEIENYRDTIKRIW